MNVYICVSQLVLDESTYLIANEWWYLTVSIKEKSEKIWLGSVYIIYYN